jgi:hypothetical protein
MDLKPELIAFSLGFGVFLSFVGSSVIAPPDPFTQLLVIPALLIVTVPIIYHVLDANEVANLEQHSRLPFPYLVGATVASTGAALLIPTPRTTGLALLLTRGGAFVVAFFAVSVVAVRAGPTGSEEKAGGDRNGQFGDGPDDSDGGIVTEFGDDGPGSDGHGADRADDGETGSDTEDTRSEAVPKP